VRGLSPLCQKSLYLVCHSGLNKPAPYSIRGNLVCFLYFLYPDCFEISSFFHFHGRSHDKRLPDTQSSAASPLLFLLIIYRLVECCGLTPIVFPRFIVYSFSKCPSNWGRFSLTPPRLAMFFFRVLLIDSPKIHLQPNKQ
jgi:hypothetical protein